MKQTTQTLQLTTKQTEILILLYRFRFLNRKHIQTILNHKNHRRIQSWLNELTDQKYIIKYYDHKFASTPSVYTLDQAGRKIVKKNKEVNKEALQRLWRDKNLSPQFRDHCQLLADIYLSLLSLAESSKLKLFFNTKNEIYGTNHLIKPEPDAYIVLESEKDIDRFFLDIFDDIAPVAMRKRIKQYFQYFDSDEWQDNTGKEFPNIILVCPNNRIKSHLFYYIQNKISDDSEINFYLSTWDMIKSKGLNKETLEKIKPKD